MPKEQREERARFSSWEGYPDVGYHEHLFGIPVGACIFFCVNIEKNCYIITGVNISGELCVHQTIKVHVFYN